MYFHGTAYILSKTKCPPLNCRSIFSPFTKEILTFILYIHLRCCQYGFYIGNFLISFIGTELFSEKAQYTTVRLLAANKKIAVFYLSPRSAWPSQIHSSILKNRYSTAACTGFYMYFYILKCSTAVCSSCASLERLSLADAISCIEADCSSVAADTICA